MIVALDIDGVLAKYYEDLVAWHDKVYDDSFPPVHVWETTKVEVNLGVSRSEAYELIDEHMSERLAKVEPYAASTDVVSSWSEHASFIAVTRRPDVHESVTRAWLDRWYGDVFDAVECTTHVAADGSVSTRCKGAVCASHGVDVFVDDTPSHVERVASNGVRSVLFSRPWNDGADAETVSSWSELDDLLDTV